MNYLYENYINGVLFVTYYNIKNCKFTILLSVSNKKNWEAISLFSTLLKKYMYVSFSFHG